MLREQAMVLWAVVAAVLFGCCGGRYIITTPHVWMFGSAQVCVEVDDPVAPAGYLTVSAKDDYQPYDVVVPEFTFTIPAGDVFFCQPIEIPDEDYYRHDLWLRGQVAGEFVNRTMRIRMERAMRETFIQTDKYLYKPGQKVQIRVLTMYLANLTISTRQYPVVWVKTPSHTRIAQWNNVDNTAGLVHLEVMLADEPAEGDYRIQVKDIAGETHSNTFRVEEYNLPRFEVTIQTPRSFLASAHSYTIQFCARYTYGKPVKGNYTLEIHNNRAYEYWVAHNITGTINGCHELELTLAWLKVIDYSVDRVALRVIVSEAGTMVMEQERTSVPISRKAVTFTKIYQDTVKRPGLPYTLKVRAEKHDGKPAVGEPVEMCKGDACFNLTVPHDGLIVTNVGKEKFKSLKMKALNTRVMLDESTFVTEIDRYYSPSNSSLFIYVPDEKLKCTEGKSGREYLLPVFFISDQPKAIFTVQILSRGHLQYYTKTKEFDLIPGELPIESENQVEPLEEPPRGTVRGVVYLPITLNNSFSPSARVIVWMVRPDREVVSDAKLVKMEECLTNKAALVWSEDQVRPGQQVEMRLTSAPNSLCSLGVVDKGTLLLDTRTNSLTLDNIFRPLKDSRWGWYHDDYQYCKTKMGLLEYGNYFTRYDDAAKILTRFGLNAVSNLELETRPCEKNRGGMQHFYIDYDRTTYAASHDIISRGRGEDRMSKTRTHFPETWLWDLYIIPSSGVYSDQVSVPDTITDWVGQAVCVSPEKGLGLSQLSNLTTFTPFFLDLTLPPSIKRGETLGVLVSIFNYLKVPLPVLVEVHDSPEYEIVSYPSNSRPGVMEACVPGNSKVVLEVKIKPTTLGQVNITVEARVDQQSDNECGAPPVEVTRRDALVKPITVKAEGFPREKTWNKYICAEDLEDGSDVLERWDVGAPGGIVEGSDRGWVTVVGSLLTISLENLGHLIRMPYGCGEQNMVNFAPNVFILQYLTVTRQATPEAVTKLTRHMNTGYQRQLLYLRSNGSYSAFGDADSSGSTWLTAFVVKCLGQAQPFITIDSDSLKHSIEWLNKTQEPDGCFRSVGQVFNKALKGGIEDQSKEALTAYVLIALVESKVNNTVHAVFNAVSCLLSQPSPSHHPYSLALKAYALALADVHVEAEEALESLMSQAVVTSNSTYWELPAGYSRSNALLVETAGYAILAMMTLNAQGYEEQVRKVVKWITVQRNGQGGFYTTQDTVIALQALAKYESTQFQEGMDFVATVTGNGINHSFAVNEENKLVTQRASLNTLPAALSLSMVGQGCAVFQSVLRYNVHQPSSTDTFSLDIKTHTAADRTCITKWISVCSTYHLDGKSNMVIISVDLVSGYAPVKSDLKQAINDNPRVFKRYEVDGSEVNFYLDELSGGENVCLKMRITRLLEVEGAKPGSVTIYDYYQPELFVSKIYRLPPSDECAYSP